MSERIEVRLTPRFEPGSRQEQVGLDAELDIQVQTHRTPLAVLGLIGIYAGLVLGAVAALAFMFAYPDRWYARTIPVADARVWIRTIVGTVWAALLLLFQGAALYFYGRHVTGNGRIDHYRMAQSLEVRND